MKIILTNGPDLNPLWTDRIAVTKDYTGIGALTLASALAAGGSLILGDAYYYKVVAMVRRGVDLAGDVATQLSSFTINGPCPDKLYWRLTNSGTTRKVDVARDPAFLQLVCSGSRTNNGAITLFEENYSSITGSVTVTFTAQDADPANIITIKHNYMVGNEETTETIAAGTQTVDLTWTAPGGDIDGYRIYRGMATGVYDGFFVSATNSYSDTGATALSADEAWFKDDIRKVSGIFIPAGAPQGIAHDARCILHIEFKTTDRYVDLDLVDVSNHATWSAGTMASVTIAENEFNSWL